MKDVIKGNPEFTRKINQKILLNLILKQEAISRAELAKISKLSRPTVSSIIEDLKEQNFILEVGFGTSAGGRRPMMIKINKENIYLIGVDLNPDSITIALTNMGLRILDSVTASITSTSTKEEIIQHMFEGIDALLERSNFKEQLVMGIGISSPGQINSKSGYVYSSNTIKNWNAVNLKELFEEKYKINTYVEHNVKAMALRELWFGNNQNLKNFIVIKAGIGIGAGIVTNGKIYLGSKGNSGEFGHTFISLDGPQCKCGNKGCLEAHADLVAIKRDILQLASEEQDTVWKSSGEITTSQLHAALANKDPIAVKVVEKAGAYMGIGIVNLIHLFNPEAIYFGGEMNKLWPFISKPLLEVVEQRTIPNLDSVVIRPLENAPSLDSSYNNIGVQSAAAIVFDKEFQIPIRRV
ncbi:ROK family transcriptional regulator [Planococcus shixiaomingii]|uniref:ROK family transcriptional regulator n=1 Tax=Planococcus shixiaomingii TaxID=3058393 RepID=UPI0026177FD3|nr:ROK family transcriptional regulator [Planococcus sp. N022]WKA55626.1 ROK family transcriptional regulator [Planococcus sp. N022]